MQIEGQGFFKLLENAIRWWAGEISGKKDCINF